PIWDPELLEQARIGARVLLADDLDAAEQRGQSAVAHLRFLVEQVALGDQHHVMRGRDLLHRLAHARQQVHRVAQHVLGDVHDAVQVACGNAPLGDVDRGLDHGQRHALHAVAEHRDVALLHRVQAIAHAGVAEVDVAPDDAFEFLLRGVEIVLAAPQGVVGVEADHVDHGHGAEYMTAHNGIGGPQAADAHALNGRLVRWRQSVPPEASGWAALLRATKALYSSGVSSPLLSASAS